MKYSAIKWWWSRTLDSLFMYTVIHTGLFLIFYLGTGNPYTGVFIFVWNMLMFGVFRFITALLLVSGCKKGNHNAIQAYTDYVEG